MKAYKVSVCDDCLEAAANGPESVENAEDGFAQRFQVNPDAQAGGELIPGHLHTIKECGRAVVNGEADCPFEEPSFSWSSCDWCRSPLGGDRNPACIVYPRKATKVPA